MLKKTCNERNPRIVSERSSPSCFMSQLLQLKLYEAFSKIGRHRTIPTYSILRDRKINEVKRCRRVATCMMWLPKYQLLTAITPRRSKINGQFFLLLNLFKESEERQSHQL